MNKLSHENVLEVLEKEFGDDADLIMFTILSKDRLIDGKKSKIKNERKPDKIAEITAIGAAIAALAAALFSILG